LESRWGGESTAAFGYSRCSATISSLVLPVGLILRLLLVVLLLALIVALVIAILAMR
jgi:hypothetical protein